MKPFALPPATFLHECLVYSPTTGQLTWRQRPESHFAKAGTAKTWNTRFAGKVAGAAYCRHGRRVAVSIRIGDKGLSAHRVIWRMVYGDLSTEMLIDHKNLDPFDNRLENLRLASQAQNLMNKRVRSDNPTGLKGVFRRAGNRRHIARIGFGGKSIYLGSFDTPEEAHAAYCERAKELHGEFARTQ